MLQALHDGHDVFFMLQVDGYYVYSKGYVLIFQNLNILLCLWLNWARLILLDMFDIGNLAFCVHF